MIKPGLFKGSTGKVVQQAHKTASGREHTPGQNGVNSKAPLDNGSAGKVILRFNNLQKFLSLSFIIILSAGMVSYVTYRSSKGIEKAETAIGNAEQAIYLSRNILSLAKEIRDVPRAFITSKDSSLLPPLYSADKTAHKYISGLKQHMLRDNSQQQLIDSLNFYMVRQLGASFQIVAIRQNEGMAPAIAFASSQQGNQYTGRLQQIIDDILDVENTLLMQYRLLYKQRITAFREGAFTMFIFMLVLTILFLTGGADYLAQLRHAKRVKVLNAELEQQVLDRTSNMDKYRFFFYNTLDLACFTNDEGYFEELNENFTKIVGYTQSDLVDKQFLSFIHPDDLELTSRAIEKLSSGVNAINFTNRFKSKTGSYKHLEWNATFNLNTKKIFSIARDITERVTSHQNTIFQNKEKEKRAEELTIANKELGFQNKEKEQRAAELIIANRELAFQNQEKEKRAAELTIANKELAFQMEEKEKRAAELTLANKELGFQNMEKEQRAAELIIANKELAFQNEEKGKRSAELMIANKELGFQNKEKEQRAAELIIANKELAFQNEEKEKRAAELMIANKELGFQNEEKEKRAAELSIANKELAFQNEEKEKRAAELTIANEKLALQNSEKEKSAAELIIANRELAVQFVEKEKLAAELTIANKELAFQNIENEKRTAELDVANKELLSQHQQKEKSAHKLVIANEELMKAEDDIRKLNEELEQKVIKRTRELESVNKELESFSYSVSHDLRAPLRAVHGYARILNEDFGTLFDPEASRVMSNIITNSKKMGQLIDDLLAFSRLGRKELVKVDIRMNEMAKNICSEIKNEHDSRNIDVKVNQLHDAQGDIVGMKQVWVNLISNAFKYTKLKEKAIIDISSEVNENEIIYCIKDNGAGFDMRYANKLFGVFQRLHADENFEGTGVGLAIVHRIISKHGGRVWAEGEVNVGATFNFSLPKKI